MTAVYKILFQRLLVVLALGAMIASAAPLHAETKPVFVLSITDIDSLLSDIGYLTEVAGVGDIGRMAAMMSQPYTQGLDKKKPLGVVVTTDGTQFTPLGFIPVKDLEAVLSMLPPQLGKPRELGGDVFQINGPVPIFVRESDGWAFIGQTAESLQDLPAAPGAQLQGMDQEYDIALRVHVSNVPEVYRQMALMQIKMGLESQLRQQEGEDDLQFELRKKLLESQTKQMEMALNEIDQLTIGWKVDQSSKNTYLEVSATALEGTSAAKQVAMLTDIRSDFSGFLSPDAAFMFQFAGKLHADEIQQAVVMMETVRQSARREIEKEKGLPDAQARETARELVDGLFEVAKKTIQSGKFDGAVAVRLAPQRMTAVLASYVADGNQLERSLKQLVDLAKDDPQFPGVKFNADEHAGVRFHTMSINVPEDEDARQVFGDTLDLAFGIGPKSVYLAVGQNGLSELKDAIDRSVATADTVVPPFQMKVALGKIFRFVSTVEENLFFTTLADALEPSHGKDHILITGKPVSNGMTYRLEIEEGVLRAIGQAGKTATVGAGPGF